MFIPRRRCRAGRFCAAWVTALALPLLDAMVPALSRSARRPQARPVRRLGFIYLPNGVAMNFKGHQLLEAGRRRAPISRCRRS